MSFHCRLSKDDSNINSYWKHTHTHTHNCNLVTVGVLGF